MIRFSSSIALDLRSIAVFRILIGGIILYDLVNRIPYAELFLSDAGAFSRTDLLALTNRPWSFSVYMMLGETSQVVALMLINAATALLLMAGLWTRWASLLCWILLISLQHRNPLVLNGGDTLLSLLVFWAMFLPLNGRWSLDALLSKDGVGTFPVTNRYVGIPGMALMLQVVFLYAFTVMLKTGGLWKSGEAVGYVVMNMSLIKAGAVWLSQFEGLLPFISKLTWHWEWFGCLLLLCPFANGLTRMAAIFGYSLMQLSFYLTLDLALFPFVSTAACLALLPGQFWRLSERLWRDGPWERGVEVLRREAVSMRGRGGKIMRPGRGAAVLTGTALALVLFWNLRGLPDSPLKQQTPDWVKQVMYAAKLRQSWGMFAANPPRTSKWYALEAQLANGDSIDLLNPSEPFTLRRPQLFTDRLPDRRWTKFLSALSKKKYRSLRDDFLEYFVSRWNRRVDGPRKIERVRMLYVRERIRPGAGYGKAEIETLATLWVEGIRQVVNVEIPDESGEALEETDDEGIEQEGADL